MFLTKAIRGSIGGLLFNITTTCFAATSASITMQMPIDFGTYNPLSPMPLDTTARLKLSCSGGPISYTIKLGEGASHDASRQMTNGRNYLRYYLYADPSRTQVLGNDTQATYSINNSKNCERGKTIDHIIYARVPALQHISPGEYQDTVSITLLY